MPFTTLFRSPTMRIFSCCALLALMFGISLPAAAQNSADGSLYSRFGLGELHTFPSSQAYAMGGGATGVLSLNYINVSNPASWGFQALTRASAGARFQNLEMTDAAGNTSRLSGGSVNHLHLGVPLLEQRLGLAVSFEPYSRMNYRVQSVDSLQIDADENAMYQMNYEGTGGLQELRGGLGMRVTNNISVGGSVNMVFGIIEEGRRLIFDPASELQPSNRVDATRLWGTTGTLGALLTQSGLLHDGDAIGIGASFTLPLHMSGTRVRTLGESLDRDTLGVAQRGTMELPWHASAGISYQTAERWHFVVDGTYEPWSGFSSDFNQFPVVGSTGSFTDRLRVSGGVEVIPAGTDDFAGVLGRIAYRLGAYYDGSYFSPAEGIDLSTTAITAGLSLPTMSTGTRLDLNFEVGTRGTTEQGLVRDLFYTVSATLNIGERWFTRRVLQ